MLTTDAGLKQLCRPGEEEPQTHQQSGPRMCGKYASMVQKV